MVKNSKSFADKHNSAQKVQYAAGYYHCRGGIGIEYGHKGRDNEQEARDGLRGRESFQELMGAHPGEKVYPRMV